MSVFFASQVVEPEDVLTQISEMWGPNLSSLGRGSLKIRPAPAYRVPGST